MHPRLDNLSAEGPTPHAVSAEASWSVAKHLKFELDARRAAPCDFAAWIKNKLDGTSADTLKADLEEMTSDLKELMNLLQVESPNLFFTVTSADGENIIYVSEWIETLTGYTPDAFLGRNCRFLQVRWNADTTRDRSFREQ